jgi:dephospho-CoA kinase
MHTQMPPDELRRRADFVILNDSSLARLHAQADALYTALADPW